MHIRALFLTNDVGRGGGKLVQPPPEMKHCKKKKNCKYRANTFSAVIFSFSGEKLLELQHRHRKLYAKLDISPSQPPSNTMERGALRKTVMGAHTEHICSVVNQE